ncbi:WSC domain-containing protein, partial [Mycena filopes]
APVLPAGWNYTGCAREPSSGRTLGNYSFTDPAMTVDKCVAACSGKGFHIAGAEYSSECYCGDAFQGTATGGGLGAPASDCNMPCAGESTQTCGAGNRLSIYSTPQTTTAPTGPTLPSGWAYISCKQDGANRLLTGMNCYYFTNTALTVESCISTCKARGFTYAGMEYTNECYCGTGYSTTPVTAPESDCSMACAGKSTEMCGSGYRLSVYSSEAVSSTNTLVLPTYWSKTSRCIVEASTGRTLGGNSLIDGSMTVEKCVSLCDSNGYIYAGLEYANECYCGNTISTANGGGVPAGSNSECNMPCAGKSSEICGAGFRLTLYTKGTAPTTTLPTGWSLDMCAIDNPSRILTGYQGSADAALTPTSCINKCAGLGFVLAGLQNGNECYCGNILTNNPIGARDDQCGTPCTGDASQNCGGGYRMLIYQKASRLPRHSLRATKQDATGCHGTVGPERMGPLCGR